MLAEIKNVLYCTDLSGNSAFAFRYAAMFAKISGSDIHILHVVERLSEDAVIALAAYLQDPEMRKEAMHQRKSKAKAIIQERQDKFWRDLDQEEDGKLRSQVKSVEVIESYPAEKILDKSVELGCDLVIMGSHERGIGHNFLGSVAKSVLRRSRTPTLIVPLPEE